MKILRPWTEDETARLIALVVRMLPTVDITPEFPDRTACAVRGKIKDVQQQGLCPRRPHRGGPGRSAEHMAALLAARLADYYGRIGVPAERLDDYRLMRRKDFPAAEAAQIIRAQEARANAA